jgi:hypothetical protein
VEHEEPMRFFRSTWLKRILLFLLLALLSAGPFGYIEQQGRGKYELVIHTPQLHVELSARLEQPQVKYGFDVVHVSAVTIFTKIISDDYIPGTSLDPLSADFLTYPDRGPPRLITIL